jgi:hypothetical protein
MTFSRAAPNVAKKITTEAPKEKETVGARQPATAEPQPKPAGGGWLGSSVGKYRTPTEAAQTDGLREPSLLKKGVDPLFRNAAGELRAASEAEAKATVKEIGTLPKGILTQPGDVQQLRTLTDKLARLRPALPNDPTFSKPGIIKITNTDFKQTEVPGLRPSGNVTMITAPGTANGTALGKFSMFEMKGKPLNAVEISEMKHGLSHNAGLTISGVYGFDGKVQLSEKEQFHLTRGIVNLQELVARTDLATGKVKNDPRAGLVRKGPPSLDFNTLPALLADKSKLSDVLSRAGVKDKKELASLLELAGRVTPAQLGALNKAGRLIDFNTPLGPVGKVGYQTLLSSTRDTEQGGTVVFRTGTSPEDVLTKVSNPEAGRPGYAYTFVGERTAFKPEILFE